MQLFFTIYGAVSCQRSSHVWARGLAHARLLVEMRGMGERITEHGPMQAGSVPERVSQMLRARLLGEPGVALTTIVHGLVWLGFLATKARVQAPELFLSDDGWLHDAVHYLNALELSPSIARAPEELAPLIGRIAAVEAAIPGFLPDHCW